MRIAAEKTHRMRTVKNCRNQQKSVKIGEEINEETECAKQVPADPDFPRFCSDRNREKTS